MIRRVDGRFRLELPVGRVLLEAGRSLLFVEFGAVDTANGAYLGAIDGGAALRLGEAMPLDLADDGRGVLAVLYRAPGELASPRASRARCRSPA